MATVKFTYSASSNISFHGVQDSGIERKDWDKMTVSEQNDVMEQHLWELIEISASDDDDVEEE